jgi:LPXTG-motif cell wall-anchored protein
MMLAAMLAVAMLAASPALAQGEPAVIADAKAKEAKAGGATAEAECKDGYIVSKAGGVVAKAPCELEPPKAAAVPPPKAAPTPPPKAPAPAPPPPPKELPKTGGSGAASLFALGAGALLVGGGLLARRLVG